MTAGGDKKKSRVSLGICLGLCILLCWSPRAAAHQDGSHASDSAAELEFRIILELNPKDTATWNRLGIVLYKQDKVRDAAEAFSRVLDLKPADFDAHDGMGLVKIKEGRYREAVSWFRKAIAISPGDTMVHYHLGYAFEMLGSLHEAEEAYRKSLDVNGEMLKKGTSVELETERRSIVHQALGELQKRIREERMRQKQK